MDRLLLIPLTCGLLYAIASFVTKRSLMQGAGILRFSVVSNWMMLGTFSLPLWWMDRSVDWSAVGWPIAAGVCFFAGQVLTFAAIRTGDVSIQTPVMGTKVLFVGVLSVLLGVQSMNTGLWTAAACTTLAIALLGLTGGLRGHHRVGTSILLALGSALAFAGADVLMAGYSAAFGRAPFLCAMMSVNALLSLMLVPFFKQGFSKIPPAAWPWLLAGAGLMAVQAFLLGWFFVTTGKVAEGNILYSSRGIWSVLIGALFAGMLKLPNEAMPRRTLALRIAGAALMSGAVYIIISG